MMSRLFEALFPSPPVSRSAYFFPFSRAYLVGVLRVFLAFAVFLSVLAGLTAGVVWLVVRLETNLFGFYRAYLNSWVLIGKKSTGLVALSIVWFGGTSLYFLFTVFSHRRQFDTSGLIEIDEDDEPDLFQFIHRTAKEAGARKPARVFLSSEETIRVTFDSAFRNLFLPVERNLVIGLPYINVLTVSEFKAVLASELGRFAQPGACLNDVRYIFGVLTSRKEWEKEMEASGSWSKLLSFSLWFSKKVAALGGGFLTIAYGFLARRADSLSRELQFRADLIGAYLAGNEALIQAIRKRQLASAAWHAVLNYFKKMTGQGRKSAGLFADHLLYVQWLAVSKRIALVNGVPRIVDDDLAGLSFGRVQPRYKWSPVAGEDERILRLKTLRLVAITCDRPAWDLFRQREAWESSFDSWFSEGTDFEHLMTMDREEFVRGAWRDMHPGLWEDTFGNFYQGRWIRPFDLDMERDSPMVWEEVFTRDLLHLSTRLERIIGDRSLLGSLNRREPGLLGFSFDGVFYPQKEWESFADKLTEEKKYWLQRQEEGDQNIYSFCRNRLHADETQALTNAYRFLFDEINERQRFWHYTDQLENRLLAWMATPPGNGDPQLVALFECQYRELQTVWPVLEKSEDPDIHSVWKRIRAAGEEGSAENIYAGIFSDIFDLRIEMDEIQRKRIESAQNNLLRLQSACLRSLPGATFPPSFASLSQNQHP